MPSRILVLNVMLLFTLSATAQIITDNDGFEGMPRINQPPEGWHNCSLDNFRYKPAQSICYPNPTTGEITINYLSYGNDEYIVSTNNQIKLYP